MHGGILYPDNKPIILGTSTVFSNRLFQFFGQHLYLFDKLTEQCLGQISIGHQYDVISSHYDHKSNILISVDIAGTCFISKVQCENIYKKQDDQNIVKPLASFLLFNRHKTKQSITKSKQQVSQFIRSAKITLIRGKIVIIHYLNDCKLFRCQVQLAIAHKNKKHQCFVNLSSNTQVSPGVKFSTIIFYNIHSQLFSVDQQPFCQEIFLGAVGQSAKYIYILNQKYSKQPKYWEYNHHEQITAGGVLLFDQQATLIIGDKKGKIYLLNGYFSAQFYTQTKLQWHTSPISSLSVNNNYLYSAGEESVVVLWHLRDYSRDFLPRIGTPIQSIHIMQQTNQVICCLSNNSLKIVDIANDKQIYTFKLMLDPRGYCSALNQHKNITAYNPINNILCFSSIAGRIQFLQMNQPKCSQFQIFQRNLTNVLDNEQPQPHTITSCCFSSQDRWDYMLAVVSGKHGYSALRFYRKKIGTSIQYELLTRIQNPHKGSVTNCFSIPDNKFLTYSQHDQQIKIWKQQRQRKKSIIEGDVIFWKCERVMSYRMQMPQAISCWQNYLAISYFQCVFVACLSESRSFEEQQDIRVFQLPDSNRVVDIKLLSKELLIILKEDHTIQSWHWKSAKNKLPVLKWSLKSQVVSNLQFITANNMNKTAILLQSRNKKSVQVQDISRVLLFDHLSMSVTSSYAIQCQGLKPVHIWSAFWYKNSSLILILDNMTLQAVDSRQDTKFINYRCYADGKNSCEQGMIEQETMQTKMMQNNQNIFNVNERWVMKKSTQSPLLNINSHIDSIHLMPNCQLALSSVFRNLLL